MTTTSSPPRSTRTPPRTPAALLIAGFKPTRVEISLETGTRVYFPPEARDALLRFLRAKRRIEEYIAAAAHRACTVTGGEDGDAR